MSDFYDLATLFISAVASANYKQIFYSSQLWPRRSSNLYLDGGTLADIHQVQSRLWHSNGLWHTTCTWTNNYADAINISINCRLPLTPLPLPTLLTPPWHLGASVNSFGQGTFLSTRCVPAQLLLLLPKANKWHALLLQPQLHFVPCAKCIPSPSPALTSDLRAPLALHILFYLLAFSSSTSTFPFCFVGIFYYSWGSSRSSTVAWFWFCALLINCPSSTEWACRRPKLAFGDLYLT